jgi:hypothetical protein
MITREATCQPHTASNLSLHPGGGVATGVLAVLSGANFGNAPASAGSFGRWGNRAPELPPPRGIGGHHAALRLAGS